MFYINNGRQNLILKEIFGYALKSAHQLKMTAVSHIKVLNITNNMFS